MPRMPNQQPESERAYIGQAVTRYIRCQRCKAACPVTWTVRSLDNQGKVDRLDCDSRVFQNHECPNRCENWPKDKLERVHAIAEAMAKASGDDKGIFLRLAGSYAQELERRQREGVYEP